MKSKCALPDSASTDLQDEDKAEEKPSIYFAVDRTISAEKDTSWPPRWKQDVKLCENEISEIFHSNKYGEQKGVPGAF